MKIVTSPRDESQILFRKLDNELRSYMKRNVTYVIVAHTAYVASINILVTGKKGTGQVDCVIVKNDVGEYECHSQGKIYYLSNLGEVKNIVKLIITRLETSLSKM